MSTLALAGPGPAPPAAERLVAAAVAGAPGAPGEVLAAVHPLVLRYCRARLGSGETPGGSAADVAQEVCLAVARALPGLRLDAVPFHAFVYRIAANKVVDAYRAAGRWRCVPMAEVPDRPDAGTDPEHRVLAIERADELGVLLDLLTPRQREILILRVAGGLSARETAAAMGSTPDAVRVAQHRALTRLRGAVGSGR